MVKPEPTPDFTSKIRMVLDRKPCHRHGVPQGVPCFHIDAENSRGYYAGVCNRRVTTAGFNGKIDEKSIRRGNRKS